MFAEIITQKRLKSHKLAENILAAITMITIDRIYLISDVAKS